MGKNNKFRRKNNRQAQRNKPYQKEHWKTRSNSLNQKKQWNNAGKQFQKNPNQQQQIKNSIREDQVGITEFVTSSAKFSGVIKARFSDFQVNEIDLNGKVLQLTDSTIPKPVQETISDEELKEIMDKISSYDGITEDFWDKMLNLKTQAEPSTHVEVNVTSWNKEQRTHLHKAINKIYNKKLQAKTVDMNDSKFIVISTAKIIRDDRFNAWGFPADYVHFLVYKENMETSEVAAAMAQTFRLRPSLVNYCGTKDKRAITTQKFCIKHRSPYQIIEAIRKLRNVHVGNFEFYPEVLKLGQLQGNRFRIALRHLEGDEGDIENALTQLKEHGFINYFGLQRFGNCASVPTYDVGVALLKADYKLAAELIMKPRENDIEFMKQIREKWWANRNSAEAAVMFPNNRFIEKRLLDGLAEYGENDYSAALRKIPRNMLLLYPHAFQSLVFNRIASRRIKEFGLQLMPGDLVYRNKNEIDVELDEALTDPDAADLTATFPRDNETSEFKNAVKPITEQDIASGEYTIFDVVLSLPGYDISYPNNVVGEWYEQMLQEYGLDSQKLKHNVKTFAMAGAYRKMLIQPNSMSWEFCTYEQPDSTLIRSDWDNLMAEKHADGNVFKPQPGNLRALLLDFCLPRAAYATMMLRELLKMDTSPANQIALQKSAQQLYDAQQAKKNAAENDVKAETEADTTDLPQVHAEKRATNNVPDAEKDIAKKPKLQHDA